MKTGTGTFVVRAVVAEADRAAFDAWYQDEHMPDAIAKFSARSAWRCWSVTEPGVHYAYYTFDSAADAAAIQDTDALRALVADFDERWGDSVTRTREVLDCVAVFGDA